MGERTVRLGLSAVMGLSAALLAWSAVAAAHAEAEQASRRALERYGGDVTRVCVALREIEPGDEISEGNVKVVEWVSSLMPEDALTSMGDASGLVATARIPAHTPLAKAHFCGMRGPCSCAAQWRFRWQVTEHAVGVLARGDRSMSMLQTLRLRIA
ncbi:MAG: SAF domain-containing protein [Collinsella intestinalis]